ncbi:MAG TPA: hypothetical protein VF458_22710 [Ktedonobacteraceae bacterium]
MGNATLKVFGYGHDFGNSETCSVLRGHDISQNRQIPSVFAPGTWREVETMAAAAGKSVRDYVQFGHYILSYTNERDQVIEKIIGQKVFDDGLQPSTTRADRERYWRNNYSLETLMVGSASANSEPGYGLNVVTGLPVHLYTLENTRAVIDALSGTYTFKLNNEPRTMVIKSVQVVAEGAGALIAYATGENQIEGVIDIGGQTTDLYGAHGQKPIRAMCKNLQKGVAAAADLFNTKFAENHGRPLSLNICQLLMRQHVAEDPYLEVRDAQRKHVQPADLGALIDYALDTVGQEIATFVAQAWADHMYDVGRALIVGGGAYYFKRSIQARLPFARSVPAPEMANAEGYARLAEAIIQRKQAVK